MWIGGTFRIFDLFGKIVEFHSLENVPQVNSHGKQTLILRAAQKRFAYYGYSKVTMNDIAADVGMAKPSLYYYYPTKERLFQSVIAQEMERFVHEIDIVLRNVGSAGEKLMAYAGMRLNLFREWANLSLLGVDSWTEVRSLSGDLFQVLEQQELKFLRQIISTGKTSGEFVVASPHQTALLLLHVLHGLRLRTLRAASGHRIEDSAYAELREEMNIFIDHLIAGIGTHSQE